MKNIASAFLFLFLLPAVCLPQANLNPEISLIGTFDTYTNFNKNDPGYNNLNFALPSMELMVDGNITPYARAAAVVSYEESFFVEELYAQIESGFPLGLKIKTGKFLVPFGKINTLHSHAWPFLERPLFQQIYFGPDGFNDIGVDLNFTLPFRKASTTLDLGIYKGDAIGKSEALHPDDQESIRSQRGVSPVFQGRLGSIFNVSNYSNVEAGLDASYGIHSKSLFSISGNGLSPYETKSLYFLYLGLDFKYKYRPDEYTSLTIQGEGLWNHRDVARFDLSGGFHRYDLKKKINTFGAFLYFDYLFLKQFSTGAKYDFTYGIPGDFPYDFTLSNDDLNKTHGISAWFSYYPFEERLALRLEVQHLIFKIPISLPRDSESKLTLRMLFSLGPHKAQQF